MKFSKSTGGIYDPQIHGKAVPDDALDIPAALLARYKGGEICTFDVVSGKVVAVEPEVETAADKAEAQRRAAYQQEADPLFFKCQRGEATEAEWLAKIAEIKARFPK